MYISTGTLIFFGILLILYFHGVERRIENLEDQLDESNLADGNDEDDADMSFGEETDELTSEDQSKSSPPKEDNFPTFRKILTKLKSRVKIIES